VWRPDLVLVIVLLIGKRFGAAGGSTAGFILGIIQDSLSGMPVGITAMPKAIAGYFIGKTKGSGQSGTIHFVFFIVLIFLHELITYAFFQYKSELSYLYFLYSRVFPNSAYTMIMLFIVNGFFNKYFTE
jgi:rod shape-determining protein MreD